MLKELSIYDYILIKESRLNFSDKLNVITGETGAGKSMILSALGLICGEKSSPSYIRNNTKKAIIEAVFEISKEVQKEISNIININTENTIKITREITKQKSVCKINDKVITRQELEKIAKFLVNMHAQRDSLLLLNQGVQRDILDEFCRNNKLLEKVKETYILLKEQLEKKKNILPKEELQKQLDYIGFQIDEIAKLNLSKKDEDIEKTFDLLQNTKEIASNIQELLEIAFDDESGFLTLIHRSNKIFDYLESYFDNASKDREFFDSFYLEAKERIKEYSSYLESLEEKAESFEGVEKRFSEIHSIKKKYGDTIEKVLEHKENLENRLLELENDAKENEHIDEKIKELEDEYDNLAKELHQKRVDGAKGFEKEIISEMEGLNFQSTDFKIKFNNKDRSENGTDDVAFFATLNAGGKLEPIKKVLSGGEISRISLAVQSVLSNFASNKTLLFDEIDAGIGGVVATNVAKKIKKISSKYQIILITHLAQMAKNADNHFLVEKIIENNESISTVTLLREDEKPKEIVRMMIGEELNDAGINILHKNIISKEED